MTPYIVTCLNERPEISRILIECWKRLNLSGLHVPIVAVCHDQKDADLCRKHGIEPVMAPANVIGDKWNQGTKEAIERGAQVVCFMGDDDSVSTEGFRRGLIELEKGADYVGFQINGFVDTETGAAMTWRQPEASDKLIGAGRMVTAQAVMRAWSFVEIEYTKEHVDRSFNQQRWSKRIVTHAQASYLTRYAYARITSERDQGLFPPHLKSGMDNYSEMRLVHAGALPKPIDDGRVHVTDFKSGRNVWPYSIMVQKCKTSTFDQCTWFMSEKEIDYVRKLAKK